MFQKIISLFKKGDKSLNNLELKIMHEIAKNLDLESSNALKRRLNNVNLVQRIGSGKEVNCYEIEKGKPIFRESDKIVNRPGEMILSSFTVRTGDNLKVTGNTWLIDGVFFSLEYFENPALLEKIDSMQIDIEINKNLKT